MKYILSIIVVCLVSSCIDFGLRSSQTFPEYEFSKTTKIILRLDGDKTERLSLRSTEKIKELFSGDACYFKDVEKLDDFYEDELGSVSFINETDTLNLLLESSDTYKDRIIATFTTTEYSMNSRVETTSYHRFYIKKECFDAIIN